MRQRGSRTIYEGLNHDGEIEYEGTSRAEKIRECFEEVMRGFDRVRTARWVKKDGEDISNIAAECKEE